MALSASLIGAIQRIVVIDPVTAEPSITLAFRIGALTPTQTRFVLPLGPDAVADGVYGPFTVLNDSVEISSSLSGGTTYTDIPNYSITAVDSVASVNHIRDLSDSTSTNPAYSWGVKTIPNVGLLGASLKLTPDSDLILLDSGNAPVGVTVASSSITVGGTYTSGLNGMKLLNKRMLIDGNIPNVTIKDFSINFDSNGRDLFSSGAVIRVYNGGAIKGLRRFKYETPADYGYLDQVLRLEGTNVLDSVSDFYSPICGGDWLKNQCDGTPITIRNCVFGPGGARDSNAVNKTTFDSATTYDARDYVSWVDNQTYECISDGTVGIQPDVTNSWYLRDPHADWSQSGFIGNDMIMRNNVFCWDGRGGIDSDLANASSKGVNILRWFRTTESDVPNQPIYSRNNIFWRDGTSANNAIDISAGTDFETWANGQAIDITTLLPLNYFKNDIFAPKFNAGDNAHTNVGNFFSAFSAADQIALDNCINGFTGIEIISPLNPITGFPYSDAVVASTTPYTIDNFPTHSPYDRLVVVLAHQANGTLGFESDLAQFGYTQLINIRASATSSNAMLSVYTRMADSSNMPSIAVNTDPRVAVAIVGNLGQNKSISLLSSNAPNVTDSDISIPGGSVVDSDLIVYYMANRIDNDNRQLRSFANADLPDLAIKFDDNVSTSTGVGVSALHGRATATGTLDSAQFTFEETTRIAGAAFTVRDNAFLPSMNAGSKNWRWYSTNFDKGDLLAAELRLVTDDSSLTPSSVTASGVFSGSTANLYDSDVSTFLWFTGTEPRFAKFDYATSIEPTHFRVAADDGLGGLMAREWMLQYSADSGSTWNTVLYNVRDSLYANSERQKYEIPAIAAGSDVRPKVEVLGYASADEILAASQTFSSVPLGTADSDREIYVMLNCLIISGATCTVTVAGNAATVITESIDGVSTDDYSGVFRVSVPSGTSGDIVVTSTGGNLVTVAMSAIRVTGGGTPTAVQNFQTAVSELNLNIAVEENSVVIAQVMNLNGIPWSWTGATPFISSDARSTEYVGAAISLIEDANPVKVITPYVTSGTYNMFGIATTIPPA